MEHISSPPTSPQTPSLYDAAAQVISGFPPTALRTRADGWTPERQRAFCEALADCGIVRDAAAAVGMTPQSAYQLKRKPEGKGFSLAWDAALVLARPRLLDMAVERAVDGNVEQYVKDGEVVGERRKKDVRHLLAAITKLENAYSDDIVAATVAQDFDSFLDCMEAEACGQPVLSDADEGDTDQAGKARKRKRKAAPTPLVSFFKERECGPGMEGYEFDGVLNRLSRAASNKGAKAPAKKAPKNRNAYSDDDDAFWSDWDRDIYYPDNF
jgi:hypothetical protein